MLDPLTAVGIFMQQALDSTDMLSKRFSGGTDKECSAFIPTDRKSESLSI